MQGPTQFQGDADGFGLLEERSPMWTLYSRQISFIRVPKQEPCLGYIFFCTFSVASVLLFMPSYSPGVPLPSPFCLYPSFDTHSNSPPL